MNSWSVTIQMKATEQYFPAVLSIATRVTLYLRTSLYKIKQIPFGLLDQLCIMFLLKIAYLLSELPHILMKNKCLGCKISHFVKNFTFFVDSKILKKTSSAWRLFSQWRSCDNNPGNCYFKFRFNHVHMNAELMKRQRAISLRPTLAKKQNISESLFPTTETIRGIYMYLSCFFRVSL